MARKRRSRARKMSVKQLAFFGPRRSRARSKKKSHSGRGRVSRARRGFSSAGLSIGRALSNPTSVLMPAAVGAAGAIGVNYVLARMPFLPPFLTTGRMRYVTQAVAALGLAAVASKLRVVSAATANRMAEGALIVTGVDVIRDFAGQAGINLSGMGYYLPGYGASASPSASGAPAARLGGMGKYLTGPGSSVVPFRRMANGMGNIGTSFRF